VPGALPQGSTDLTVTGFKRCGTIDGGVRLRRVAPAALVGRLLVVGCITGRDRRSDGRIVGQQATHERRPREADEPRGGKREHRLNQAHAPSIDRFTSQSLS